MFVTNVSAASYAVTPVTSNMPSLTGGHPLNNIANINPRLSKNHFLTNKGNDIDHKPTIEYHGLEDIFTLTSVRGYQYYNTKHRFKTVKINDDNTYFLLKNRFKYQGQWYDVKYIIKQINNSMSIFPFGKGWYNEPRISFGSDAGFTGGSWGEVKIKIQILDKNGNKARIPEMLLGIDDLDWAGGYAREAAMVENFTPTKENTFIHAPSTYKINKNIVWGTDESDDYRPVYFKDTGLENGEVIIWAGQPRGIDFSWCSTNFTFAVTPVMVNYKADINGKISGLTIEEVHKGDNPLGTKTEANKGCVFKNWTANKDLYDNSGKLYKKGDKFSDNELKTMQIEEDTVFTAHFGKLTGSLKINKTN